MSSQNQNKPPAPVNPVIKNLAVHDASLDKHSKIGTGRMIASKAANQSRQPLAQLTNQTNCSVASSETEVSECEQTEFTKDEVNAILNDKFKGKKFDSKGNQEWMNEHIRKLKVCIKLFQKDLEDLVKEKDNLHTMLDFTGRKSVEAETAMKIREEELNASISKLENTISSFKESLANEESQKLDAIVLHNKEKEARMALEKNQVSIKEGIERVDKDLLTANNEEKIQEVMYKKFQEYTRSLQEYNIEFQNQLTAAINENKRVEKEKAAIVENHNTLRGDFNILQQKFSSAIDSREDAFKQKETALQLDEILKDEIYQKLGEGHERQVSDLTKLRSEIIQSFWEERFYAQKEQISVLEHQLDVANQKLKIIREYEERKHFISTLEDEVREKEAKILEGKILRKNLRDTILELKELQVVESPI